MLKLFFWLLLAANGVLFAFHQGYLGGGVEPPRETARLRQQLQADKLRLLSESEAKAGVVPLFTAAAASASTVAAATTAVTAPAATAAACIEIGNFGSADGQRFAAQLAALGLQPKASARAIADASGAGSGYMVYLAAEGDKDALGKNIAELRRLGIKDFFVLPPGAAPGGISLGVFKSEEGAQAQLARLTKIGLRGARLHARGATSGKQVFQLRGLEPQQQAAFDQLRAAFPGQQARPCAALAREAPAAG
jgi:hypothetical protein